MNGNGHKRRLETLEAVLEPSADEEVQAAWQAAWDSALHALLLTMAPEHVQGLSDEMAARERPDPSRSWGRLWSEFHSRLVEKVGPAPGHPPRYPDAPLALPAALAEVYLAGAPNLQAARCQTCGLRRPTSGELVPVVCENGDWRYADTGEPCGAPGLPHVAVNERAGWRPVRLLTACPLCGGAIVPAWTNSAAAEARGGE